MKTRVISRSEKEPITAAEVEAHTKAVIDDAVASIYIAAARTYVEDRTGRALQAQTIEVTLDRWPCRSFIELPKATPLVSVTYVKYRDFAEVEHTMDAAEYVVDANPIPGKLSLAYGQSWPSAVLSPASPIRIRYTVGDDAAECPGELKYPLLLLVAGMNENRESEIITNQAAVQAIAMSYGVEAFLSRAAVVSSSY